jgi:hypothetical protein
VVVPGCGPCLCVAWAADVPPQSRTQAAAAGAAAANSPRPRMSSKRAGGGSGYASDRSNREVAGLSRRAYLAELAERDAARWADPGATPAARRSLARLDELFAGGVREGLDARDLLAPPLLRLEIVDVAGRLWQWGDTALVDLAVALDELGFEFEEPDLPRVACPCRSSVASGSGFTMLGICAAVAWRRRAPVGGAPTSSVGGTWQCANRAVIVGAPVRIG